jgi:hypothetical protein
MHAQYLFIAYTGSTGLWNISNSGLWKQVTLADFTTIRNVRVSVRVGVRMRLKVRDGVRVSVRRL